MHDRQRLDSTSRDSTEPIESLCSSFGSLTLRLRKFSFIDAPPLINANRRSASGPNFPTVITEGMGEYGRLTPAGLSKLPTVWQINGTGRFQDVLRALIKNISDFEHLLLFGSRASSSSARKRKWTIKSRAVPGLEFIS